MNPCLGGWRDGEDKHRYMGLCHQVLSRSQLNAIIKLKDAGIVTRNLVVLPSTSNVSLANNGTHLSLGSRRLAALLADPGSGFGAAEEKYAGDLAIKIVEHFLTLFVGAYSAAPYRLDFASFHPERALGFLPHELDFTHLRMLWRRWKKKARLGVFGRPITPVGPPWLDRCLAAALSLRGDFVPDVRLIDYPVALSSTAESPALDGRLGNDRRLKRDLAQLGIFDENMSLYLPYKHRAYHAMGFSGFEGRHYSAFPSLLDDLGDAADLQWLVTALAYRYALTSAVTHADVPDDPELESERRQIFFGAAIGIPTFFTRAETRNRLLARVLAGTHRTRASRRYPGYVRTYHAEYRRSLIRLLEADGADLIEAGGIAASIARLRERVDAPDAASAAGRLTRGILDEAGARSPLGLSAVEFNGAAERYYRETLRRQHMDEALDVLADDCRRLDRGERPLPAEWRRALEGALRGQSASAFASSLRRPLLDETASAADVKRLIHLMLVVVACDIAEEERR